MYDVVASQFDPLQSAKGNGSETGYMTTSPGLLAGRPYSHKDETRVQAAAQLQGGDREDVVLPWCLVIGPTVLINLSFLRYLK